MAQKKRIMKLFSEGVPPVQISNALRQPPELVRRFLRDLGWLKPTGRRPRPDVSTKQIVKLRDDHDMCFVDISDMTGLSLHGVRHRYYRAKGLVLVRGPNWMWVDPANPHVSAIDPPGRSHNSRPG